MNGKTVSFTQTMHASTHAHERLLCSEGLNTLTPCQIHFKIQLRWRPFKLHKVLWKPLNLGQDALCDQRLGWYQLECSMLQKRGGCFQKGKKEKKLLWRVYLSSNYTWTWDREMEAEGETSRSQGWKEKSEHKYPRWRESLIQFQAD